MGPGLDAAGPARDPMTLPDFALVAVPAARGPGAVHPEMRADRAARILLSAYLSAFESHEPGVRADLDSEHLHDLRVACRRTRALLGELEGIVDQTASERMRGGLAWLGAQTGPLRDLDVLLAHLREDPPASLEPLMLHAERRRQEALRALRRALGSKRRAKLFSAWQLCLDETAGPEDGDAARPIEDVARERIERRLERFLKRGRALAGGAAPGKVHKLRYLIDAFGGAFAPEAAAEVVGRLKKLQDALGTFNDREVEIRLLERFGGELLSAGAVPAATLLAMGRRQADLERDMKRLRRRFRRRFERFAEEAPIAELLPR